MAYTWSHAIDNQSEPLAGEFLNFNFLPAATLIPRLSSFTTQFDSQGDRASADFDQRHNLVFYSLLNVPAAFQESRFAGFLRNWQISWLGAVRSGFPFSVYSDRPDFNNRAELIRPEKVNPNVPIPGGKLLLDRSAFDSAPTGQVGNTGRNAFQGPGLFNIDLSVARSFALPKFRENARLTVRADAYNFLNHANLNNPVSYLGDNSFGEASYGRQEQNSGFPLLTPLTETARLVQLMLRLQF